MGDTEEDGFSQFSMIKGKKGEKKQTGENSNLDMTENSILGPSYNYVEHIKTPSDLDMSADGTFGALADDISGILAYLDLLVSGNGVLGVGSKTVLPGGQFIDYKGPLGNKFFLETAVKCVDKETREKVKRSIYINNVPGGEIPLISNLDGNISFGTFEGLLPGVLSNLSQIRPMQILSAFTTGSSPTCQEVTMEIIDTNNQKTYDKGYITNDDISIMPKKWFPNVDGMRQDDYDLEDVEEDESISSGIKEESFCNKQKRDYSKMPDDILIKIYYSMLGLLGIYILLKMMKKKKK